MVLRIRSAHLAMWLPIHNYFCAVYDIFGKSGYLSTGCWNLERKLGIITHFSEIMKLQSLWKKIPYIALNFTESFFELLLLNYLWNMRDYPNLIFNSNNSCQDLLSPHSHKPTSNAHVSVAVRKYREMQRNWSFFWLKLWWELKTFHGDSPHDGAKPKYVIKRRTGISK